ncbi:hypothetical protein [Pedobacter nyackensis]|uniref:hypothetical protein n=1 Tax=Pedobacter nyackensis TaxID=475255 RepID=UPI00292E3289|nr:hypothetical protein [Pedobacter nyackensis]
MQPTKFLFIFLFSLLGKSFLYAQEKGGSNEKPDGISISKGLKFSILTFSLSSRNAVNDNNILVNYIDQKKNSWDIRADGGYIIKKDLGVGLGLSYGESKDNNIIKKSDGGLTFNKSFSNDYGIRPYIKNFIPLDNKNRFYIINQTELQFLFDHLVKESTTDDILTRTYTTRNTYGIGLRPGLIIFIVKNFAFETTVDIFGVKRTVERSRISDMPDSKVATTDLNFKINVLKVAFGFSTYF